MKGKLLFVPRTVCWKQGVKSGSSVFQTVVRFQNSSRQKPSNTMLSRRAPGAAARLLRSLPSKSALSSYRTIPPMHARAEGEGGEAYEDGPFKNLLSLSLTVPLRTGSGRVSPVSGPYLVFKCPLCSAPSIQYDR